MNQIKNEGITPGTYVEITFSGELLKLKGNRTMKVYDVAFDFDNVDTDLVSEGSSLSSAHDEDESASEDDLSDEIAPSRPVAPARRPTAPNASAALALLNKNRSKSA